MRIPRILHQTFRTPRPLHPGLERCIELNTSINPDWEFRYYDDARHYELLETSLTSDAIDLVRRIDPAYGAARADIFRYACIYAFGGCYLDIKSICTHSLSSAIDDADECLLSFWNREKYPGWGRHPELAEFGNEELQQWFLLAAPRHPLIKAALDQAIENLRRYRFFRHGVGRQGVLRTTGPVAFTRALHPRLNQTNHRLIDSWKDLGLRYDYFSTLNVRSEAMGSTYRDSIRPLIVPSVIPRAMEPLYFSSLDVVATGLRAAKSRLST